MAYIPVPTSQKVCVRCHTVYYAKDRRRLYCSSSCNTLAWMDRQGLESKQLISKAKQTGGELDYTLSNVTTIATGVLIADGTKALANALLDIQPTNAQIMEELKLTQQRTEYLLGVLSGKLTYAQELTIDVRAGVGASGNASHKAILASQQKRKGLLSSGVELPKSTAGR